MCWLRDKQMHSLGKVTVIHVTQLPGQGNARCIHHPTEFYFHQK